MSAATVHAFAPRQSTGRAPENHAELAALMDERSRAAGLAATVTNALAAPAQRPQEAVVIPPATSLTLNPSAPAQVPPDEAGARAALASAIRLRDQARRDVDGAEVAVSRARRLEAEAETKAAASVTTELRGGDDLAARIAAWSAAGGEGDAPDLAPDPASLDARHERDRARVHADAARQAARQLEAVLADKRAVLTAAEVNVTTAKREVVRALVEAVAIEGAEAERVLQRARVASYIVNGLLRTGPTDWLPSVPPTAAKLGRCGEIGNGPDASQAERQEHTALWSDLIRRLDGDASAAL